MLFLGPHSLGEVDLAENHRNFVTAKTKTWFIYVGNSTEMVILGSRVALSESSPLYLSALPSILRNCSTFGNHISNAVVRKKKMKEEDKWPYQDLEHF